MENGCALDRPWRMLLPALGRRHACSPPWQRFPVPILQCRWGDRERSDLDIGDVGHGLGASRTITERSLLQAFS